jgi:DNA-binding transcriptional regulator YiaG
MVSDVKRLEIKILRLRAGIQRYELTARLGILADSLSDIELRRRQPPPELMRRIIRIIKDIPNGGREDK